MSTEVHYRFWFFTFLLLIYLNSLYIWVLIFCEIFCFQAFSLSTGSSRCVDFLLHSSVFHVCAESFKRGTQSRKADSRHKSGMGKECWLSHK